MLKDTLPGFFERDLNKLKEEIGLYKDENALWIVNGSISNSAGNLCLHLIGNLNHFIGATLGNSGYERELDKEFSDKNILREKLLNEIDQTIAIVNKSLTGLSKEDLEKDFPLEKHGEIVKTDYMLLHLLTHLNYHIGQVNYHRRMVE